MRACRITKDLSIRSVVDLLDLCKKLILMAGKETSDARLQEDLERLALSAPHTLADIGFERDVGACAPGMDVWRRQGTRVVIQSSSITAVSSL